MACSGFVVDNFCLNSSRRQLPEARVRSHLVVLTPELFDQDLRIDAVLEPLHRQALVAELAIEGSRSSRSARACLDRCTPCRCFASWSATAGPLGIRTPGRCPSAGTSVRRERSPASRAPRSRDPSGCCRPHRSPDTPACTHRSPSGTSAAGRWRRHRTRSRMPRPGSRPLAGNGRGRLAATRRRGRLSRHLQPVQSPEPMRSIRAHRVPPPLQEHLDASIAVARILRQPARASPRLPAHRAAASRDS